MARFTGKQIALGQFNLPFGEVVGSLTDLLENWDAAEEKERDEELEEKVLRHRRVFQTVGPYDLVVELEPESFRRLPEAVSRLVPRSSGAQWTLAKEIYSDERTRKKLGEKAPSGTERDPLCFIILLRIHRYIYRRTEGGPPGGADADDVIVRQIEAALEERARNARICAGLGWTDFLVIGEAVDGRPGLLDILAELLRLEYRGRAALQRSITLVGYEWAGPKPPEHTPTIPGFGLKIRLRPTAVGTVFADMKSFCRSLIVGPADETDFVLSYTGGKRDIIFVPRRRLEMKNMLLEKDVRDTWLDKARELKVEHAETNFLLNYWEDDRDLLEIGDLRDPDPDEENHAYQPRVDLTCWKDRLPAGVLQSIHGIHALFRAALNDSYKSLDIATAVQGCEGVLEETLEELHWLTEDDHPQSGVLRGKGREEQRSKWRQRYYEELKIWCSRVEKVIGERCAGSFDNKMVPSPSLTPYRGHVNKILVTADCLVREFIRRVSKALSTLEGREELIVSPPAFHLGATDRIESDIRAGVVTLPNKYMFSLVLAVPQLWSESGVRIFHRIYRLPFEDIVDRRVECYLRENASYTKRSDNEAEEAGPSEARTETSAARRIEQTKEQVILDLADHFADLIVRFFGLQKSRVFIRYLVTITCAAFHHQHEKLSEGMRRMSWQELLQRLLLVYEADVILQTFPGEPPIELDDATFEIDRRFRHYWADVEPPNLAKLIEKSRGRKSDDDRRKRAEVLAHLIARIDNELKLLAKEAEHSEEQKDWPWPALDEGITDAAIERLLSDAYYGCQWEFMWDFIERIVHAKGVRPARDMNPDFEINLKKMEEGEVVDLQQASFVNGYFSRGYQRESELRLSRDKDVKPAGMAALGRSTLLYFLSEPEEAAETPRG